MKCFVLGKWRTRFFSRIQTARGNLRMLSHDPRVEQMPVAYRSPGIWDALKSQGRAIFTLVSGSNSSAIDGYYYQRRPWGVLEER